MHIVLHENTRYSGQILMKLGLFGADSRKITHISNFMNIRIVGAELIRADRQTEGRQTDMTKLLVAFRGLTNGPQCDYKVGFMSDCFAAATIN